MKWCAGGLLQRLVAPSNVPGLRQHFWSSRNAPGRVITSVVDSQVAWTIQNPCGRLTTPLIDPQLAWTIRNPCGRLTTPLIDSQVPGRSRTRLVDPESLWTIPDFPERASTLRDFYFAFKRFTNVPGLPWTLDNVPGPPGRFTNIPGPLGTRYYNSKSLCRL